MLGCELGEGSANSWLTLAVRTDHGQPTAVAALFFTAFAVSEGITRIFAGPVVDRLGRARTVRITTALGVLGVIGFILAGNEWVVLSLRRAVGHRSQQPSLRRARSRRRPARSVTRGRQFPVR
jgi:MFS family permease